LVCFPRFDSPSVFASLLDDKKGGSFRVAPVTPTWTSKQLYWPDTNVLLTRFFTPDGVGEVTDFMPLGAPTEDLGTHVIVRACAATDVGAPAASQPQAAAEASAMDDTMKGERDSHGEPPMRGAHCTERRLTTG
jgi:GH15 family glucan-1,4-alpha-glucosidase